MVSDVSGIQIQYLVLCQRRVLLRYKCDCDFVLLDSSFICILLAKYESSRPLEHIHLVANCDITLIHHDATGKSAPP